MGLRILLVNPPIYDFSAYDYWLKPYGLLRVGGMLRQAGEMMLFDFLDRLHPGAPKTSEDDGWGRGPFASEVIAKPPALGGLARRYRRFGLSRGLFQQFLADNGPFDFALIQSVMTYWYPDVREVLEDLRQFAPRTRTVIGGVYATLCPEHARSLEADLVIEGSRLEPLWSFMGVAPDAGGLPRWDLYPRLQMGVLKLAVGCPFRCTYCSVPKVEPVFRAHPIDRSLAELEKLSELGVRNMAFYDDALLYRPEQILIPFFKGVLARGINVAFHTPNALNARFVSRELAELMVRAGFQSFYLGFESSAYEWQHRTGGKVYSHELARAVAALRQAGANAEAITAYLIIGHPSSDHQHVEQSMRFAHDLGIRVMLSEFSPIPGTPDGETCRRWVDLDEPLCHNKTFFAARLLGHDEVDRLKGLCRQFNRQLSRSAAAVAQA